MLVPGCCQTDLVMVNAGRRERKGEMGRGKERGVVGGERKINGRTLANVDRYFILFLFNIGHPISD